MRRLTFPDPLSIPSPPSPLFHLQDELVKILKANHMATTEREVAKKADTILAQADKDGDGVINFDEFVLVSKRFPNILYPSYTLGQKVTKNLAGE
jgi:hypothetical protein